VSAIARHCVGALDVEIERRRRFVAVVALLAEVIPDDAPVGL
jgi:hypothetical protein